MMVSSPASHRPDYSRSLNQVRTGTPLIYLSQ